MNNEYVDESYIEELLELSRRKFDKTLAKQIVNAWQLNQKDIVDFISKAVDNLQTQLHRAKKSDGLIFILNPDSDEDNCFEKEPLIFKAKQIEGRWMFKRV